MFSGVEDWPWTTSMFFIPKQNLRLWYTFYLIAHYFKFVTLSTHDIHIFLYIHNLMLWVSSNCSLTISMPLFCNILEIVSSYQSQLDVHQLKLNFVSLERFVQISCDIFSWCLGTNSCACLSSTPVRKTKMDYLR